MPQKPSVLFVCLGNICRSPMAEGAMRMLAAQTGMDIEIDSAGTGGWHVGETPDRRGQATAASHGVDISGLRARQVSRDDFTRFTHIIALDAQNLSDLKRMAPSNTTAELSLLLDYVEGRQGQAVADPYYGGAEGFETTWAEVLSGAKGLLTKL